MGSGISLSDKQLTQIIKRDLAIDYHTLCSTRKPCVVAWEKYRNELDEVKYVRTIKAVDLIYEQRGKITKY